MSIALQVTPIVLAVLGGSVALGFWSAAQSERGRSFGLILTVDIMAALAIGFGVVALIGGFG